MLYNFYMRIDFISVYRSKVNVIHVYEQNHVVAYNMIHILYLYRKLTYTYRSTWLILLSIKSSYNMQQGPNILNCFKYTRLKRVLMCSK